MKKLNGTPMVLRWSEHVPVSDVQDPLGLSLRGSARLATQLLFCITSITPRARYFSFIPWCVQNWQNRERGRAFAVGLSSAIALREKALTLGCIAHHEGKPCVGGALIGSNNVATWFQKGEPEIDLRKLPFAKNPALDAYFNSLVNLAFFVPTDDAELSNESEEEVAQTFDDIELSPLGIRLANAYEQCIGGLDSVAHVSTIQRRCKVGNLRKWGARGGLCELADSSSPDRNILREVFFAHEATRKSSHFIRNRSLLLIMDLTRQLSAQDRALNEAAFGSAVYYDGIVFDDGEEIKIDWAAPLVDIATRWRMFYFHHYMSVSLEGAFAWLITQVAETGLAGASVTDLCDSLNSPSAQDPVAEVLGVAMTKPFGKLRPADLFRHYLNGHEGLDVNSSKALDKALRSDKAVSEDRLEQLIRDRSVMQLQSGLALPMLLLGVTLARYTQWEGTDYGNWLASASTDPYVDIVPPSLARGLNRRFGAWWNCRWADVSKFVLTRYVVQQHQSMSFERTAKGDRCLLQVDGDNVTTQPNEIYEKIGMGNARFNSAVRILKDLGLLLDRSNGVTTLTKDGAKLLRDELASHGRP
jgi:hypothetical protein